jgi:uncharacterized protein YecE (DUF72 family)
VPQSKWLEYYAARFAIGEINSTYYRIAPASVYASIDRKTPPDFHFFAKVHADVTHARKNERESLRILNDALSPLHESGKLVGLLAQFPASFQCASENLKYVIGLREYTAGTPLCVEFRQRSWLTDEAVAACRDAGVTWVCPDEPDLPDLMPRKLIVTTDILYIRLHGRNSRAWYDRGVGDRYDYNYSETDLVGLANEIVNEETSARRAYVLFNNCYAGQAPRNAWWLKMWLTGGASPGAGGPTSDELNLQTD